MNRKFGPNSRRRHGNNNKPNGGTKITDVNSDCLEQIFKHLPIKDLLNVADSSKQLKPAADLAFSSTHGRKTVSILAGYDRSSFNQKADTWLWFSEFEIMPYHSIVCFKLLRCFGHLIQKVIFECRDKFLPELEQYIINYCADSLTEIKFIECSVLTMNSLTIQFPKVKAVHFSGGRLGRRLSNLDIWFPNLRVLTIADNTQVAIREFAAHFPHLIHIDMQMPIDSSCSYIGEEIFAEILQMNPQLQCVCLSGPFCASYFQRISRYLQNLHSLSISCEKMFTMLRLTDSDKAIQLKNLKKLNINYLSTKSIPKIPLTFDALEELTFNYIREINDNFINFIRNQTSLVKLTARNCSKIDHGKKIQLALPSLKEIHLECQTFSIGEVMIYLDKCKFMETFRFCVNDQNDVEALKMRLGKRWRMMIREENEIAKWIRLQLER